MHKILDKLSKYSGYSLLLILLSVSYITAQESVIMLENGYVGLDAEKFKDEDFYSKALNAIEILEFTDKNVSRISSASHIVAERRSIDLLLEAENRKTDISFGPNILALIADKYFYIKDFESAQEYYLRLEEANNEDSDETSARFKLGYTFLVDRQFKNAKTYFENVAISDTEFNSHGNYYLGICEYFLGDTENAIVSFKNAGKDSNYKAILPYYLSQIYFQDEAYEAAIDYAKSNLNSSNKLLMNRILGFSYLALKNYDQALPFLEDYAANTPKLTENEFYQIANLNHKLGHDEKAAEYFKELSYQDSELGQMSNYILGSIYLEMSQKTDAQSAFKQASKTKYRPAITDESEFLYFKLSADLGQERIAINGLSKIDKKSPYFSESQNILSQVLRNADDYYNAQRVIESLAYKSNSIQETYKSISYQNGLNELENKNYEKAVHSFEKSIITIGNEKLTEEAYFYSAIASNELGDKEGFVKSIDSYLQSNNHSHRFESYYLKAYFDIENSDYNSAIQNLSIAIKNYSQNSDDKALFDDALVRLADLNLFNNNYSEALHYYDYAIENKSNDLDYVYYQKAMIYGVNNQQIEKLTSLESILRDYDNSDYRDDALFEIAESLVSLQKNNEAYQMYDRIINEYGNQSSYTSTAHLRQGLLSYNSGDMQASLEAYKLSLKKTMSELEKRQALIAIEEIYINELKTPEKYFEFAANQGGVKLSDITKDSLTYEIGIASYSSGEYTDAIRQFDIYIKQYPSGYYIEDARIHIGDAYLIANEYEKAMPHYSKLLENEKGQYYKTALKNAALISYNHSQDFKQSYIYYDKLISEGENNNTEYLEAALYSAFKSRNREGIYKYAKLSIDSPYSDKEAKSTAHYYIAKTYLSEDDVDSASPHLRQVTKLSNNNQSAESSYLLSTVLYNQDLKDQAEVQAFQTTKNATSYPYWVAKSIILIGDIYTDKGDNLNASAAYESVIENFKGNNELVEIAQDKLQLLNKIIKENNRVLDTSSSTSNQNIEFTSLQTLD